MHPNQPPATSFPASSSRREFIRSGLMWSGAPLAPAGTMRGNGIARHCILLLMEGGPSHIDTFDPKPKLDGLHMRQAAPATSAGRRCYVRSPFRFRRAGKLGIEINERFHHFAEAVDQVCFYRGLQCGSANHLAALHQFSGAGSFTAALRGPARLPPSARFVSEPRATLELYGVGDPDAGVDFVGRRCLRARQLVETGTRFVQVTVGGWDTHHRIEESHGACIRSIDKPVAALIKDLARIGLLEETLVVWGGEFGRSPDSFVRGDGAEWGRDHNTRAMTVWLAGAGAPRGRIVGETDELGETAVETVHPIADFQKSLLHLLGEWQDSQVSQRDGRVIRNLVA